MSNFSFSHFLSTISASASKKLNQFYFIITLLYFPLKFKLRICVVLTLSYDDLFRQLIVMAIEVSTKRALSMLVHLLKRFYDTTIVTVDQLDQVSMNIEN